MIDLLFKVLPAHALLGAGGVLASATVVVGVVEELGLFHLFNRDLAARAAVLAPVGEFETAVSAHELVFLFGGDHTVTLSATDEPCEREYAVGAQAWITFTAQERLYAVLFGLGNHGLVFSTIQLATPFGEFKPAIVERHREDFIDGASTQGLTAFFSHGSGAKAPLFVSDSDNLRRGVAFGQHQVPHAPDERKAFGVFNQGVCACQFVRVV